VRAAARERVAGLLPRWPQLDSALEGLFGAFPVAQHDARSPELEMRAGPVRAGGDEEDGGAGTLEIARGGVHVIDGVTMRKVHSFPSGHTTTAFAMALIMAYIKNRKTWSVILPLLASLAGYSRVYLAQHFPTDIFAGMCIGIVSAIVSLLIYRKFIRYLNEKDLSKTKLV